MSLMECMFPSRPTCVLINVTHPWLGPFGFLPTPSQRGRNVHTVDGRNRAPPTKPNQQWFPMVSKCRISSISTGTCRVSKKVPRLEEVLHHRKLALFCSHVQGRRPEAVGLRIGQNTRRFARIPASAGKSALLLQEVYSKGTVDFSTS